MRIPWWKSVRRDRGDAATSTHESPDVVAIETLAASLRERGVSDADAAELAEGLAARLRRHGRGARDGFAEGVAAGWHAMSETRARMDRTASDMKEVERLMGAFTGELSKLDEVLEVLAAYVRRMRTSNPVETSEGRILH